MVLQRVCQEGGLVSLTMEGREWPFPLLAETETRIALGVSELQASRWNLKPGGLVQITLLDRGRRYRATTRLGELGECEGEPCAQFLHPRELNATDYDGLSDYVPDQPVSCTFTSPAMDICEGRLRALGQEGVELALWGTGAVKEGQLKVGAATTLELALDHGGKAILAGVTVSMDQTSAAVRFQPKADADALKHYRGWLQDAIIAQDRRDRDGFSVRGMRRAAPGAGPAKLQSIAGVQLLSDREPLVLVIGEGAFSQRIAESLGRKFGIAGLDFVQGEVRPMLASVGATAGDWGRVKLLLIHQRLRVSSGLELTRQLTQEENCPLPVLLAGTEEDVLLKRNRAIAAGAVDFISVDPFRILAVMRTLEQTLALFR
jgi:CheY-like chemotaxis protein